MKIKLIIQNISIALMLLFCLQNTSFAQKKYISITIDDLPFVGEYRNFHLNMMINSMTEQQVPATGFIIASEVRKNNWEILHKFRDAGFALGNHTLSHANLNKLDAKDYIHEIKAADTILLPVLTEPKYFRYPYLAMSSGQKKKKFFVIWQKSTIMWHLLPSTPRILFLINVYYRCPKWSDVPTLLN